MVVPQINMNIEEQFDNHFTTYWTPSSNKIFDTILFFQLILKISKNRQSDNTFVIYIVSH